jgi:bacteriocin-like protein
MTSSKSAANVTSNVTADAGSSKNARLDSTSNPAAGVLSDEELSKVSGGRVRTSDRAQKALLDFVKG